MKNEILTALCENGKYAGFLYSYELTPSESVRPILRAETPAVFDTAEEAAACLWGCLRPWVRENTNYPTALSGEVS